MNDTVRYKYDNLHVECSIQHSVYHSAYKEFVRNRAFGCVSLEKSESGFLIQDHSDHGVSERNRRIHSG